VIKINNREIGGENPTYIIAEMGINHNGSLDIAMKMVKEAAKCGVDAVKVQIVDADKSYTKDSESHSLFKSVELKIKEWEVIVRLAEKLNIDIFATFAHAEDLIIVNELQLPAIKVSSSNLTNLPLLKAVAVTGKPILLSTGMSYISEIDEAIRCIEQNGNDRIGILQCTALYPTPPKDVNLLAIETLRKTFSYTVGFSDHTEGITSAIASVVLGAKIIEKHFTLDKNMEGPDHHFSATVEELSMMVESIREIELSLGASIKGPVVDELPLREKMQRSLVSCDDIKEGDVLTEDKISIKRSDVKGLEPRYFEIVLGRRARKSIPKDKPITFESI
jgi:sialic acid synthase SpsE